MPPSLHHSLSKGFALPLGATLQNGGINFSLISSQAKQITLCLINQETKTICLEIALDSQVNKTGHVWHILISELENPEKFGYCYKIDPPFNSKQNLILDPYVKSLVTSHLWGQGTPFYEQNKTTYEPHSYIPLGNIVNESPFDWENDSHPNLPKHQLVIYEMHVRGFTKHPSSQTQNPGTFLGIIEKIPYLLELGVNAVELLPIQEFDEMEYSRLHPQLQKPLYNYWGYSTVNYFSPMNRYATSPNKAINEFKMLVKELHRNGIEIILDVVFNHTAEGNENGPVISFKGIDNDLYYMMNGENHYLNYSGCGNTFNANQPHVVQFIIDCLRYWVTEMHVDGFRFDLASALTRDEKGFPMLKSPLIESMTNDPLLASVKLIAEPWDAAGMYQVGHFAPETLRWSEWNDKYRDCIRRFIKGEQGNSNEFAMRLCGSEDLYYSRGPCNSINFITAHDGFSLADVVAFNGKHNQENEENNQDGTNNNESWNCGVEGPTNDATILQLRWKQMRNLHLALMVSQGVPMIMMGDEYGHSKQGNNNTWCQDNDLNWFQWDSVKTNNTFHRFYSLLIHFRKNHPVFQRQGFMSSDDIDWHGTQPFNVTWTNQAFFVAFTLKDPIKQENIYVAFNAFPEVTPVQFPAPPPLKAWHWVVDTSNQAPNDFYCSGEELKVGGPLYEMAPYSSLMLMAK